MKPQQRKFRLIRKGGRKKSRTRIGWRVLVIYFVILMIAGALATALNLQMEDGIKAHETESSDHGKTGVP